MQSYYAPDFQVKIEGLTMEADVSRAVVALTYDSNLDTADMFNLVMNNADLRFTDSPLFDVGKDVEIYMGYVGDLKPMMLGEIAAVNPSFPESGAPTLTVTGYDKSHHMRHNHKLRTFPFANASLIAAQIAAENLLIPEIDPTKATFESKTQYSSDMALLKKLADQTFFDVYVYWDRLYFQFPRPQTEVIQLEWGKNLSSFSPRLSTSGQTGVVTVLDYDQELAQTIVGLVPLVAADLDLDAIVERLGSTILDQLASLGTRFITGQSIRTFPDALTLAKAVLARILEGLFEGHGTCIGIPELRAGRMIEISGVGRRFSGKYRLRSVTHTINGSGYRTTFEVTQRDSGTMLQLVRRYLQDEPAPNKSQKLDGTFPAVVVNNVDEKGLGRVLVQYPGLGPKVMNWATVSPQDVGTYFIPDIGDIVLVDFENGDIDQPVIKGMKWNVNQMPPELPTPDNFKRVIQSRNGHIFMLDDDPDAGGVRLSTLGGASVKLNGDGSVEIEAKKNLSLKALQDVTIDANNVRVTVQGTMDVSGV